MTSRTAPTLDDVARAAGVSTATVSRTLNTPGKVTETTRMRVMEAVKALDYTPNFSARAMASNATRTIGAVIPTMENAIFARGLQAFEETLRAEGYMLLVASSSYQPTREAEQVRALISRGVDGILLIGQDREAELLEYLRARKTPAVTAWSYQPDAPLPSIGFDNRIAMRCLAERVISLGHVKLGMISGETERNDRARLRVLGVRDAMSAAGLSESHLTLIETSYAIEQGKAACRTLLQSPDRPTAILCGNDVLAAGAVMAARALGISVPEDLSITGFDDIELATLVTPALTTVHVPHREMGKRSAEALLGMLSSGKRPAHQELTTRIELRDSLAHV